MKMNGCLLAAYFIWPLSIDCCRYWIITRAKMNEDIWTEIFGAGGDLGPVHVVDKCWTDCMLQHAATDLIWHGVIIIRGWMYEDIGFEQRFLIWHWTDPCFFFHCCRLLHALSAATQQIQYTDRKWSLLKIPWPNYSSHISLYLPFLPSLGFSLGRGSRRPSEKRSTAIGLGYTCPCHMCIPHDMISIYYQKQKSLVVLLAQRLCGAFSMFYIPWLLILGK